MFYASEITFIEILTTKQQWLKIDKNSGALLHYEITKVLLY